MLTSSIKYSPTFKGGTFISDAVMEYYLYYTALRNKAWTHAWVQIFDKDLNRLIYLDYWSTKD